MQQQYNQKFRNQNFFNFSVHKNKTGFQAFSKSYLHSKNCHRDNLFIQEILCLPREIFHIQNAFFIRLKKDI